MSYAVIILDEAREEMRRETRYSIRNWGTAHAKRYMAELRAKIHALKTDAKLYTAYDSALPNVRVMSWKGHRVVYTLDESASCVTVLAITSVYQSLDSAVRRHR